MTRILVTNDDGVFSEGLRRLGDQLGELGDVTIVAPDREQSATSHSLTIHRPLRLRKLEETVYSVDGTPTDCVNLAVLWLMKEAPPDLIVSGINFGVNLGDDVTYSGTVSATFEGALLGIPSVAFSQEVGENISFERSARFARKFIGELLKKPLSKTLLLNVNIPAGPIRGVALGRLGRRTYNQSIVEKTDPQGRRYFWIAGTPEWHRDDGTDHQAITQGKVAVTPLHLDLTDYRAWDSYSGLSEQLDSLVKSLDE